MYDRTDTYSVETSTRHHSCATPPKRPSKHHVPYLTVTIAGSLPEETVIWKKTAVAPGRWEVAQNEWGRFRIFPLRKPQPGPRAVAVTPPTTAATATHYAKTTTLVALLTTSHNGTISGTALPAFKTSEEGAVDKKITFDSATIFDPYSSYMYSTIRPASLELFQAIVYTVTDVKDLHDWMVKHFVEHPLFVRLVEEELNSDPIVEKLYDSSEEGQKVTRNKGDKFLAVFRRIPDPYETGEKNR
ncbi:hypothetical protein C0J52_22995 [Blattella germanica]|nr:hypothetical protein C0J52_22995 [Blattella germanica]